MFLCAAILPVLLAPREEGFRLTATPIVEDGRLCTIQARLTNVSKKVRWAFEPDLLTTIIFVVDDKPTNWGETFLCLHAFDSNKPSLKRVEPGDSITGNVILWDHLKPGLYEIGVRYTEGYAAAHFSAKPKEPKGQVGPDLKSRTFSVEVTDYGHYVLRKP